MCLKGGEVVCGAPTVAIMSSKGEKLFWAAFNGRNDEVWGLLGKGVKWDEWKHKVTLSPTIATNMHANSAGDDEGLILRRDIQ